MSVFFIKLTFLLFYYKTFFFRPKITYNAKVTFCEKQKLLCILDSFCKFEQFPKIHVKINLLLNEISLLVYTGVSQTFLQMAPFRETKKAMLSSTGLLIY